MPGYEQMTSHSEPSGDPVPDDVPYLPPSLPTLPPVVPPQPVTQVAPDSADLPFLPNAPVAASPPSPAPPAFDAKAMVASQKHVVDNPVYGAIPKSTPESLAAAKALRDTARRKRTRNKVIGRSVALVILGGIGAGGWFGYQAYQDDQDRLAADKAARAAAGETSSGVAPGALTPLGNQENVIDALDAINSGGATASAGGLLDIVDQAEAAVNDINGTPNSDVAGSPSALTIGDLLPEPVVRLGTRLDDIDGYERYVIDARRFATDNPTDYARFLAVVQAQPQSDPAAAVAGVVPQLQTGEIGFAVLHDGDRVVRAVIVSTDPAIHLDYTP